MSAGAGNNAGAGKRNMPRRRTGGRTGRQAGMLIGASQQTARVEMDANGGGEPELEASKDPQETNVGRRCVAGCRKKDNRT